MPRMKGDMSKAGETSLSADLAAGSAGAGIAAGLGVGAMVGLVNGIGVAVFKVNSFIMTVGMLSILSGIALTLSGGMPVYGLPKRFGEVFAYGAPFGIPAPVLFAGGLY